MIYHWSPTNLAVQDMFIDGAWNTLVFLGKMSNLSFCVDLDFTTGEVDYLIDCDCDH